jgi:hypothetical protein
MRKKVDKTIKASDFDTIAHLHVAAYSRQSFPSTCASSDDTVAQLRMMASLRSSFPYTRTESSNNSFHYANSDSEQLEMPFKKHKRSNKKIGEPEHHQKTMAFAYQVISWNFQTSPKRSIFTSPGDGTVMDTPNGPSIHPAFFKSQYLDVLGKAVSAATTNCSESVHKHQHSFRYLPLKQILGLANESLLLVTPVIPKGAGQRLSVGLDTGGLHHRFLQRERLIHPELDTSSSDIAKL